MNTKLVDRSSLPNSSLKFTSNYAPSFLHVWHCHAELELNFNVRGTGMKFIGEHIETFQPGDLVLIGKNIPHRWLLDIENKENENAESLVVHFKEDFVGYDFLQIPELRKVKELLVKSKLGLKFTGAITKEIGTQMVELNRLNNFDKLFHFVKILGLLAESDSYEMICSEGYQNSSFINKGNLSEVLEYLILNFQKEITLDEIASISNMSKSSFCRFFKKVNGKTFTEYLNNIRIGFACKIFHEEKSKSISQVCYECGYGNLSHFNRQFKNIMQTTPSNYIKTIE